MAVVLQALVFESKMAPGAVAVEFHLKAIAVDQPRRTGLGKSGSKQVFEMGSTDALTKTGRTLRTPSAPSNIGVGRCPRVALCAAPTVLSVVPDESPGQTCASTFSSHLLCILKAERVASGAIRTLVVLLDRGRDGKPCVSVRALPAELGVHSVVAFGQALATLCLCQASHLLDRQTSLASTRSVPADPTPAARLHTVDIRVPGVSLLALPPQLQRGRVLTGETDSASRSGECADLLHRESPLSACALPATLGAPPAVLDVRWSGCENVSLPAAPFELGMCVHIRARHAVSASPGGQCPHFLDCALEIIATTLGTPRAAPNAVCPGIPCMAFCAAPSVLPVAGVGSHFAKTRAAADAGQLSEIMSGGHVCASHLKLTTLIRFRH
jgi:hypothetical protein